MQSSSTPLHTLREPNLWNELKFRCFLLGTFLIINLLIPPHERALTESQLLNDYRRPKCDSYIPSVLLVFICIFTPLAIISMPWLFDDDIIDSVQALLSWSLGICISLVLTETMKVMVGRPRPDFYYRCFPNGCMTETLDCTGKSQEVREGRKSFPSGHSSFSFCSLGFVSLWLCGRMRMLSPNVEITQKKVFICVLPLMPAALISASRCMDNHHHWSDVVAGSTLGLLLSYICYCLYYNFLTSELSGEPYARATVGSNSNHNAINIRA